MLGMDTTSGDTSHDPSDTPIGHVQTIPHVPMTEAQIQAVHIGVLTPLRQPISLAAYDPAWPRLFERAAARVQGILADRVLLLEHVGSTTVPDLAAKPKIDMLLVVANAADEPAYAQDVQAAGYLLQIREPDWSAHRMFTGRDSDIDLHGFSAGCPEINRMLLFRN